MKVCLLQQNFWFHIVIYNLPLSSGCVQSLPGAATSIKFRQNICHDKKKILVAPPTNGSAQSLPKNPTWNFWAEHPKVCRQVIGEKKQIKCFLQGKALTAIYSYQLLGLNCGSGQHLARLSKLPSLCMQLHGSHFGLAAGHSVGKQKDPGTSLHAPSHSNKLGLQTAQFGRIGGWGDSNWSLHISMPWAFLVQSNSMSHLLITQSI